MLLQCLKGIRLERNRKTGFKCPRGCGKGSAFKDPCPGKIDKSHPIHPRSEDSKKRKKVSKKGREEHQNRALPSPISTAGSSFDQRSLGFSWPVLAAQAKMPEQHVPAPRPAKKDKEVKEEKKAFKAPDVKLAAKSGVVPLYVRLCGDVHVHGVLLTSS